MNEERTGSRKTHRQVKDCRDAQVKRTPIKNTVSIVFTVRGWAEGENTASWPM